MLLRTAFVDDVAAARDFTSGDWVRKTDFRGFFPSPYAGRVVFVDYRNGTVQVQWPWGSEQEYPTELIRDLSGTVAPPMALDQTYSSWSQTRFENDVAALKADAKWGKKLTASVVARYESATLPVWRAACEAHHSGTDEISAFLSLSRRFSSDFGDDAVRLTVANLYDAGREVPARLALYWKDKGRRYKVTQREKSMGKIRCPRCGAEGMKPRTYRANKKVLTCTPCGFSISPKDLIWDDSGVPTAEQPAAPPAPAKAASRTKAASDLLSIAVRLSASDPRAARALAAAVTSVTGLRPRLSVVNPGFKTWEQHMDEMLSVLKSLDQELGSALSDHEDAAEFAKFFEDGISEEEELRKILERTTQLGKIASRVSAEDQTSGFKNFFKQMKKKLTKDSKSDDPDATPSSYRMDDKVMDDFVEGSRDWMDASQYVEEEFRENRDFFDGAKALLADMDDVRIEPTRDKIRAIRDRIPALIKRGQDILKGARDHLRSTTVTMEGDEDEAPINEDGKPVQLEGDDSPEPVSPDTHGTGDPKHLQWTVKHYVDMLQESLDDPQKMTKYLKELYNEVGPQLKAASSGLRAERAAARRVITPILVRLAKARPSTRPVILPVLRAVAGR